VDQTLRARVHPLEIVHEDPDIAQSVDGAVRRFEYPQWLE
jgi:hypothetical protein